jgi:hypothetical protein
MVLKKQVLYKEDDIVKLDRHPFNHKIHKRRKAKIISTFDYSGVNCYNVLITGITTQLTYHQYEINTLIMRKIV